MGLFIKLFDTHSQYESYTADTANFIKPNVSYCKDQANVVHYNPLTPPAPSHDYVEIGGIKWATMNVGANSITDYGQYFQWGDTQGYTADQVGDGEGQKYFDSEGSDYIYYNDGGSYTKYNGSDYTVLQSTDDAVTAAWGGSWRMPTTAEFQALGNAVNTAWTNSYNSSGVAGLVCTDKTDSSKVLFFPAAGECEDGENMSLDGYCNYLSSSLDISNVYNAKGLVFSESFNTGWNSILSRERGNSVRGVLDA